ncbi:Putative transporter AraJ [Pseudomonas fluorescens]|uniref:Transporter AraJ n=1 Tax=Pseudomonas fluorescens TaxID=294 RepID=A0A5E7R151_PSEFL|nr:MFS transporter [Pseudomonas fluorescens]VVP68031.1 Putative transporter AraJ [Pseudomonas fluorescens]
MTSPAPLAGDAERAPGPNTATATRSLPASSSNLSRALALFALALGSFCIGTSEFASMGIIQLFSASLGIDVPQATNAVTAYALGVVVGAPVVTLAAARLNRRTLLLALMALFVAGNVLSAVASNLPLLMAARFISGLPQGAYFGAGAMVASYLMGPGQSGKAFAIVMTGLTVATIIGSPLATFLGQHLGWRETYLAVAALSALALLAIRQWLPRSAALNGVPIRQELSALREGPVWGVMAVATAGIASLFAIYTFVGPIVTDAARLAPSMIPVALAIFGIGMTLGNTLGGRLADRYPMRGIVLGFGAALAMLVIIAKGGQTPWLLFPALFALGAGLMASIPTLQVRLTTLAPAAPSLMGAMTLAACNLGNAIGAWAGGVTIDAGYGLLSVGWAGFALTLTGLAFFGLTLINQRRPALVAGVAPSA